MLATRTQTLLCCPHTRVVRVGAAREPFIAGLDVTLSGQNAPVPDVTAFAESLPDITNIASNSVSEALTTGAAVASTDATVMVAGAVVLAAVAGLAAFGLQNKGDGSDGGSVGMQAAPFGKKPLPRQNAVVVFGAGGRIGRVAVKDLVESGRTVIAACRSSKTAATTLKELGLTAGKQAKGDGILFIEDGVDISNADTLTADLFKGATQVLIAVGPVFGALEDGSMGYIDGMSSERVDAVGVCNVAEKAAEFVVPAAPVTEMLIDATSIAAWTVKDDVIMGGQSASAIAPSAEGAHAVWEGNLVLEGGGFCAVMSAPVDSDWSKYDGVSIRVLGDGQSLKFNVKTKDQTDPTAAYQATFDTVDGEWTTVKLPWHAFVPVVRANTLPDGKPLDPTIVSSIGLVLSRFNFNGAPNPNFHAGAFKMELSGVAGYSAPKPSIVMASAACIERNALIGDNDVLRVTDVPIVQLNPGGTLNWKYKGEIAVRTCGLPYSIVRSTGLTDEAVLDTPFTLEVDQGDRINGSIGRGDVGGLVASALTTSAASNKTFEVRRRMQVSVPGGPQVIDEEEKLRLFLSLTTDARRAYVGIAPFPAWVKPNAEVSAERKAEILGDVRVVDSRARDTRLKTKPDIDTSTEVTTPPKMDEAATQVAEVKEWVARYRARVPDEGPETVQAAPADDTDHVAKDSNGAPADDVLQVQAWISNYRSKTSNSEPAVPEDVAEARQWIANYRSKV